MISTVTISSITIIAASSVVVAIGIIASIFLIGLLSSREILHAGSDSRHKLLVRSLTIGIIPILMGFIIIVALKVVEILA